MSTLKNNSIESDSLNKQQNTEASIVNAALFKDLSFEELLEHAEAILNTKPEIAYELTSYAENLALQFGDANKIASAKSLKGASLYKQDRPKLAIEELTAALHTAINPLLVCQIMNRMSYSHSMLADYKSTILLAQDALKIAQDIETKDGYSQQVFSYNNIGQAYYRLGVYDAATTAYLNGLEIADESEDQLVYLYGNLSLVQQNLGNFEVAFKYGERALELATLQNNERVKALNLGNFSYFYFSLKKYDKAIDFAQKALSIGDISLEIRLHQYHNLAEAYRKTDNYPKAQEYIEDAKRILKDSIPSQVQVELLRSEAKIAYVQGNLIAAKTIMHEAKDFAEKTNYMAELYKIHSDLSTVYDELGEVKKALEHHKEFHRVKTQVHSDAAEQRIQGLMIQHEVEELIKEKDLTTEENQRLEELVHQRTKEIQEAHLEMLERLAIAGEKRDDDTGEHTARVGRVCGLIAKELGCDEIYVDTIKIAARLHDIGKIGVPDSILLKPQKLTDAEFEIVKTHAEIGAEMLTNSKSKLFQMAERIAGTHHEKWNGKGYPNGLKGEEIPLEGRIVAVADVYDALTNDRPYKDTWTHEDALAELFRSADSHLDRQAVEAFSRLFEKGIITPEDLREKPKKKAKIRDAYDQEIFAEDS